MRLPAQRTVPTSVGLVLLDSGLDPIFVNRAAAEILSYPQSPEGLKNLDSFLTRRIRSTLISKDPRHKETYSTELCSGRRLYLCHSFTGSSLAKEPDYALVALLLERSPSNKIYLQQISERFRLTTREQEVLQLLMHGLTSKEIAMRMEISPNTVKAFLHLIMIKMGVSTRSGIVGKAVTVES